MEFLPENIDKYAVDHTTSEPKYLADLQQETWQKVLVPRMLSGHFQGRLLSMVSHLVKPNFILEIGTYTGYSALCLAEGLSDNGQLHTIDINEELKTIQSKYIARAGMTDSIKLHVGNALDVIPELKFDWDLVFIDADKENYVAYYNLVLETLKPGAHILVDNVLWSGKVTEEVSKNDRETSTLIELNAMIQADKRVENILLPVRDGLTLVRVL